MRYQGSEAYNVEQAERGRERLAREARPSFEVVTGGGLDARARAGVSPAFVARLRVAVAVAAVLIVLGMARVALTSATVSLLQDNAALSAQISEAQTTNEQLRIERSILSSNSRISRIATQNYGMVLPSQTVTLDLAAPSAGSGDGADAQAQGDQGTPAGADGEAAQSGEEAAPQTDLS
ncbi:cell division protein FtsL [Olsenella profusa]|uniref:Cell division protein FtsL n=1 Tax=Olsenella profusa TaxID=138595 RepID=A0ABS2F1V8_9ACTN|nr:cell division protein FtsL [Olsenella profusa]MBM6774966.1 cell division protein FtsL [Olsenella profusa]